jgi:hypothetical protein
MNFKINDAVLDEFDIQWEAADPCGRAQLLCALIMYVKRKYDVQNFKTNIDAKTRELESIVSNLELKEFLPVSRAIGYARKQIKDLGGVYGRGLQRKPKGAELKDARSFKPITLRDSSDPVEEDDFDPDFDDDL